MPGVRPRLPRSSTASVRLAPAPGDTRPHARDPRRHRGRDRPATGDTIPTTQLALRWILVGIAVVADRGRDPRADLRQPTPACRCTPPVTSGPSTSRSGSGSCSRRGSRRASRASCRWSWRSSCAWWVRRCSTWRRATPRRSAGGHHVLDFAGLRPGVAAEPARDPHRAARVMTAPPGRRSRSSVRPALVVAARPCLSAHATLLTTDPAERRCLREVAARRSRCASASRWRCRSVASGSTPTASNARRHRGSGAPRRQRRRGARCRCRSSTTARTWSPGG